jgi:hypothetical protein
MNTDQNKDFRDCFLCETPFQYGPGLYDGKYITTWKILICNRCLGANHDGIVLGYPESAKLERHLRDMGISVRLNAKGWLDIPR